MSVPLERSHKTHTCPLHDKEVGEMVAWALERATDEAMEAAQFQGLSLVVMQVRQSIARRRERRA